jgi:hypothetical protein
MTRVPDHGELVMPVSHASAHHDAISHVPWRIGVMPVSHAQTHHDAISHAARMHARCLTLSSRQLISWSLKGDQ